MIQKKICMLGGYAVGKTSLVSRYVSSMFSEKYMTTIGVKIDKKGVDTEKDRVELVIWDIYGQDDFQKVRMSYLRGASGYLLVLDGTRGGTLVRHIFPADGEYKLAARLFRGVEEGYVGVEGNDTPNTFVITIDGEEVFSTTIGVAPTRNIPVCPPLRARARAPSESASIRRRRLCRSRSSPSDVKRKRRPIRSKSRTPRSASSARTWRDAAGWLRFRRLPARAIPPASVSLKPSRRRRRDSGSWICAAP